MSDDGPITYWCRTCGGVAHPVTGCVYTSPRSAPFLVCGPCVRSFWAWLSAWTNKPGKRRKGRPPGPAFFDHVGCVTPVTEHRPTP